MGSAVVTLTNTSVPALVESRAALGLAAVHGLLSSAVSRSVAHPNHSGENHSYGLFNIPLYLNLIEQNMNLYENMKKYAFMTP